MHVKTPNNKIPVSSVFNDSKGVYGTTVCRCFVRAANAFRVTWSERVFVTNALTEIAWEDAVQGLGIMPFRSVREKQGNVAYPQRVLQRVTSLRVVSLVFRGHDLLKIANINPQQEATLSLWKKIVPQESAGNGALVLVNT